ncbi:MAG TPA: excinuclease ABC subunit UvrC [Candidatus Saccharimonadales bacterium]|nr:excinuclease ABC subunit UvrC [Candidatus Saccharimonadales bacterium]HSX29334.1 excinuclease ABC subunit UvrC [Candidatus Saccharimonadales bacterium]
MNDRLAKKLKELPASPGVYFHKDASGTIIYVGKAARLTNRVRQYFQKSRARDPKTDALVAEIVDTDWMVVDSEIEALFLEAEMIRRYMPRYNILLRDDKSLSYIRIDYDSDYPTVTTTRRPLDDGARYFGPYLSTTSIRAALKGLRRAFPFATKRTPGQKRATLFYHLGLDPGLEEGRTSLEEYRANLRKLIAVIEGRRVSIERELEKDMQAKAKAQDFEAAATLRNQLNALRNLTRQVIFSDKEFLDISKDHALGELVDLLSLPKFPARIEGYDISHMQGTDVVASMVVFSNGASDKSEYRKFKTKTNHNNDFYNMNETLKRRLTLKGPSFKSATALKGPSFKNDKNAGWKLKLPDLVLIDGGKGQLDAAIQARDEAGCGHIPFVGLAKREEQIVISRQRSNVTLNTAVLQKLGGYATESDDFILVNVPHSTNLIKLLQRIRDESHRFAVSYHSVLKEKRTTSSMLDDIPGIGPATRKKLLRTFGSMRGVRQATEADIASVIGAAKAKNVVAYFK